MQNEIKKLDPQVVNKIAAGEILHGPANALKELLENSLDAEATNIRITVKDGGIKLIQIQDNGKGIRKEDFKILCERHTTSKLTLFSDLNSLTTFGFRGEALCSISHVSHLSIASMTPGAKCAFKSSFSAGKMISEPKPLAGTQGTQVTAEDLFYNVPPRRKSLNNPKEEFLKIQDVVSKYAIHCENVGISLKKYGEQTGIITTHPNLSKIEKIRLIYGDSIARELLHVKPEKEKFDSEILSNLEALITNSNFNLKKLNLILFINNRLVESTAIKKAIEYIYINFLPKGTHPFCYLKLDLPPDKIDVNVHPTKSEVIILNQEVILEIIQSSFLRALMSNDSSRTFSSQPMGISTNSSNQIAMLTTLERNKRGSSKKDNNNNSLEKGLYQKEKIRNDPKTQTLHQFFHPNSATAKIDINEISTSKQLSSIKKFKKELLNDSHESLKELFTNCTFIGSVDSIFCLIQHQTKLYLINTFNLSKHIIYQYSIYQFRNFSSIEFSTPLPLKELLILGLDNPLSEWKEELGSKEDIATYLINENLLPHSNMLHDYFSIQFDLKNLTLCTLPQILENYLPDIAYLPLFLLRLSTQINWNSERDCFGGIFQLLSDFYCLHPEENDENNENKEDNKNNENKEDNENKNNNNNNNNNENNNQNSLKFQRTERELLLETIFPKGLNQFYPPTEIAKNGTIVQIASLEKLYQQFERC